MGMEYDNWEDNIPRMEQERVMSDKLSKHEWDDPNNPEGYCVHCGSARKDLEKIAALEAKLSKTEEALYNTIEEGVAHAFLNIDHDDKRARVLTQEEVAAAHEKRRARKALAGGEEA